MKDSSTEEKNGYIIKNNLRSDVKKKRMKLKSFGKFNNFQVVKMVKLFIETHTHNPSSMK